MLHHLVFADPDDAEAKELQWCLRGAATPERLMVSEAPRRPSGGDVAISNDPEYLSQVMARACGAPELVPGAPPRLSLQALASFAPLSVED